jgi:hypothetical protein
VSKKVKGERERIVRFGIIGCKTSRNGSLRITEWKFDSPSPTFSFAFSHVLLGVL